MNRLISAGMFCLVSLVSGIAIAQDAPEITQQNADAKPADEPKTGVILLTPAEGQVFTVDEDGKIYEKRGYKGVVPGVRDQSDVNAKKTQPAGTEEEVPIVANWIGFQPYEAFSRVFVQMSGEFEFSVTRPDPLRIEISLPGAKPGTQNDMNGMITRWFPTNVDRIEVKQVQPTDSNEVGGLVISIFLKRPVGFLYRRDASYVFVDVETKVEP